MHVGLILCVDLSSVSLVMSDDRTELTESEIVGLRKFK
jgi:hypothetical protein